MTGLLFRILQILFMMAFKWLSIRMNLSWLVIIIIMQLSSCIYLMSYGSILDHFHIGLDFLDILLFPEQHRFFFLVDVVMIIGQWWHVSRMMNGFEADPWIKEGSIIWQSLSRVLNLLSSENDSSRQSTGRKWRHSLLLKSRLPLFKFWLIRSSIITTSVIIKIIF